MLSISGLRLGSAWLRGVRNLEGSKNKQLFLRLPVLRGSSCGLLSVAPLAASRCSKIPARSGTSMLWISVACRLRSSVMATCHETGSCPGQRPFVSKGRKRVSIPPVMRQVGSNLRQNSFPLRPSNKTTSLERIHPTGEDKGGGGMDNLGRLVTLERTDEALSAYGGLAFFILHSPFCIRFRVASGY